MPRVVKRMNELRSDPERALLSLVLRAATTGTLKKVVLTKPQKESGLTRAVLTAVQLRGEGHLQLETFHTDNKVKHQNLPLSATAEETVEALLPTLSLFSHVNLLTTAGDCELLRAKSGKVTLLRGEALSRALASEPDTAPTATAGNDRTKAHILSGNEPFLRALDVSDKNGRVYDKKQAKFRQINRFLELLRDVEKHLPATGTLYVLDLCCGKSYLSFAVYHYLSTVCGREVVMEGVDLKSDVVESCNHVATTLGFDGLRFYCQDVALFTPARETVDLVVSLHACDIATDLVLNQAIRHGAKVILSTPCCHHELNHTLNCPTLSFIAEHSMLRQKLCDAATDALRLKLLESRGYDVAALELIDPEETPKNIMLRAIYNEKKPQTVREKATLEYEEAKRFLLGE